MEDSWMVGNSEYKWHGMDVQLLHTVVVVAAVVDDHVAGAGIDDVHALDRAVGQEAVTGIVEGLIVAAVVALVLTAKAHVENHALAASLKTGKKTVVLNQGTEVTEVRASTAANRYTCRECRVICLENEKVFYYPLYLEQHCRTFTFFYHLHINYDDALVWVENKPKTNFNVMYLDCEFNGLNIFCS